MTDAQRLLDEFCDKWRPSQPGFVKYFETHYKGVYRRWVRSCYLDGHEADAYRIPRTTSHSEAYHSYLKKSDLNPEKCGRTPVLALSLATGSRAHRRQRLCARRLDWLVATIYKKTIKRYQTIAAQLAAGIRRPRHTFRAPARAATVAQPAAPRAEYNPAPNAGARKRTSAAAELEEFNKLIERAEAEGVFEADIASAIHAANTALLFALGANRATKRACLGVNPQAVGGASMKRAVGAGKRLGAGQRVPKLSKAVGKNEKAKKRAKLAVMVEHGPLTEKDTQEVEAAKKAKAAKAWALKGSAHVAATFAATAGTACASARVKRKSVDTASDGRARQLAPDM